MRAVRVGPFLLGVDGGGTQCRARLADASGAVLGEGLAGPANLHLGLDVSLRAVRQCAVESLRQAGLAGHERSTIACLALAGASEPTQLAAAQAAPHPFRNAIFTSDAKAACVGAHEGRDGGVVIVGTGSIGWATLCGREHRVGGWGFHLSDEGSGAWIGRQALQRVLWACDGLIGWTCLLSAVFQEFDRDEHRIVHWTHTALPRDYAALAPKVVEHARQGDVEACQLMNLAAQHIEILILRLDALGAARLCLMGSLAGKLEPYLSDRARARLVAPVGDALSGALHLARVEACRLEPQPEAAKHG